eukprot:768367-Hanusia_phi.AAC.6
MTLEVRLLQGSCGMARSELLRLRISSRVAVRFCLRLRISHSSAASASRGGAGEEERAGEKRRERRRRRREGAGAREAIAEARPRRMLGIMAPPTPRFDSRVAIGGRGGRGLLEVCLFSR